MPKSTPHYHGHRQRLRERFKKTGFHGFRDYEALELMLFWALPRRDVKPIAKDLLKKFRSLKGVMDAPLDELAEVKGISEAAATFIVALKGMTGLYLRDKLAGEKAVISSTGALLDYCHTVMSGLRDEQFRAIYLNSQNQVIGDEVIQEGTVNQSVVYPRKVMERALRQGATALIFVHNHPGGSTKPSREDEQITGELVDVARSLDITVHDHLIVSREGHYSFRESGKIK